MVLAIFLASFSTLAPPTVASTAPDLRMSASWRSSFFPNTIVRLRGNRRQVYPLSRVLRCDFEKVERRQLAQR
jgi:hypothetical protein